MPTQSWTIGSTLDCHIVVENSTVSGHHCRLTFHDSQLTLEDLNSTNGTYVNGERVTEPRIVSITDRITLGQSLPMPWPDDLKPVHKHSESASDKVVITFGRGPENSVVLDESNVSTQHARLIISGENLILEDLGSTNGTSVGTIENKIHRAQINSNDTIFFGSTAYTIPELIQRHESDSASPPRKAQSTPRQQNHFLSRVPAKVVIGVASIAAIVVIWSVFGGKDSQSPQDDLNRDALSNMESVVGAKKTGEKAVLSSEQQRARSLFVIVVSDTARETPFRVGTGFAIDSQHVATTASVISAVRDFQQNGYPEAYLYNPVTQEELVFVDIVVHPRYQRANDDFIAAQSEYESILDRYEIEPPPPEKLESLKAQLLSTQEKAFLAIERKTTYDVAVIKTKQVLDHWLTGADPDSQLRPNLKLSVQGLGFDLEDPFFDPQSLLASDQMESRVRQVTQISHEAPPRLLAEGNREQFEVAFFGSPTLNPQGQVVAIYSRPTPPVSEQDSEKLPETFDAPLFQRVRECLKQQP